MGLAGEQFTRLPVPGETFAGKFRILGVLGEGGMGVVYRAHHERLEREVAIKVVRPEIVLAGYELHRFEREARAAARLESPHVVRVFDIDTSPEGLPFLVMELLEGTTLSGELLHRGSLPVSEAVRWTVECCSALTLAEANGVVHRDIKPSNLFLTRDDAGRRQVKLLDFGITKLHTAGPSNETASGVRMGTLRYMSPEQLRSTAHVDQRSDLWSLGVVLYELLSGGLPFRANNDADLTIEIVTRAPVPLADVAPGVPADLCAIVERALRKNPSERFQSASDFSLALAPFLVDAATTTRDVVEPTLPAAAPGSASALDAMRGHATASEPRQSAVRARLVWLLVAATLFASALWWLDRASGKREGSPSPSGSSEQAPAVVAASANPVPPPSSSVLPPETSAFSRPSPELGRAPAAVRSAPPPAAPSEAVRGPRDVAAEHDFERTNPYAPR
jgi:serine/threonine protein kinase